MKLYATDNLYEAIPMNIALFGASGAIGQRLARIALDNGDAVTAYVRRLESVRIRHARLQIIAGELSNSAAVEAAIADADIVISALGPALDRSRKLKGTPIADGHAVIMSAMRKLRKKRLVTLATPTLRSAEDGRSFATVVPGMMAKILFPNGYAEMKKLEEIVRQSDLDWTVVRIINPNVKDKGRPYGYSFGDRPAKLSVSRENVAKIMYAAAFEDRFIGKMPIVYNE